MDISDGISVSFIEKIYHSNHVYEIKSVETLKQLKSKIQEISTIDGGKGLQKQYYNCEHVGQKALQGGDSYSFCFVENKQLENTLYNSCLKCGRSIIEMMTNEFKFVNKARHDNLHPQLRTILQLVPTEKISDYVFSLFKTIPTKSVKILPNVLGILEEYILSKQYQKDEFLSAVIMAFSQIKSYFLGPPINFQQAKEIEKLEEIDSKWLPLINYFKKKKQDIGVNIVELNKIAVKRFFLSSSQPPNLTMGAIIMVKANKLNKEALEIAKAINYKEMIEKIGFDIMLECPMASTYLVQSSLMNQLAEFCIETWKPLAHGTNNYESEARACFAYSEAAIHTKYNPATFKRALSLIEDGYNVAKNNDLYEMQFMGLMKKADIFGTRNSPETVNYRQKAIKFASENNDEKLLMRAYHNAFVDYIRQSKFEDALKYVDLFQERAKLYPSPEVNQLYAKSLQTKSDIYLKMGFPQKAAEAMQEQLTLIKQQAPQNQLNQSSSEFFQQYETLANRMSKGMTSKGLKKQFSNMEEQLKTSINFLEQNVIPQLAIYAPQSIEYGNNLMTLGRTKNMLGNHKGATEAYQKALEVHMRNQNEVLVADCYSELGKIQFKKKKMKQGIQLLNKAIGIREESNSQDLAFILDKTLLGLAFRRQGKIEESLKLLEEASRTAITFAEGRGLETTRILYSGVISNTIDFFCETTYQLSEKNPKKKEELLLKCLEIIESYKNREIINRFEKEGRKEDCPANAILFEKENELVEELATLDYLKEVIKERVKTGQMTKNEGEDKAGKAETKIEKIKNQIDQIRAEIYLQCVSPGQIPKPINHKVVENAVELLKNEANWGILEFMLIPCFDEDFMWSLLTGMEGKHITQITDLLGETEDSEFSEYKSYTAVAFVIDNNEIVIDTQTYDIKELNELKTKIVEAVDTTDDKSISKLSTQLYQKLIPDKIKQRLKDKNYTNLTIIPDKMLHAIPWEILFDGDQYFGLQYVLSKSFSLDLFRVSYNQTQHKLKEERQKKIMLFGNPTLDLPGAENEVQTIGAMLKEHNYNHKIVLGKDITNESFTNNSTDAFPILHYAGHGVFLKASPQLSYLLLDGYNLTAHEISNIDSNALVAILSACETGVTRLIEGAEVLGLIRSLQLSSIPSVIATNWRVADNSALDLMIKFYEKVLEGKNIGKALKEARNYINEKYEGKILHWAGYTLYGNPYFSL